MIGVADMVTKDGHVYEVKTVSMSTGYPFDEVELAPGEIRLDLETGRLIELIGAHYTEDELLDTDQIHMPWNVRDVLTGQVYVRGDDSIDLIKSWAEMEALAWAARDHPDIEIAGD